MIEIMLWVMFYLVGCVVAINVYKFMVNKDICKQYDEFGVVLVFITSWLYVVFMCITSIIAVIFAAIYCVSKYIYNWEFKNDSN